MRVIRLVAVQIEAVAAAVRIAAATTYADGPMGSALSIRRFKKRPNPKAPNIPAIAPTDTGIMLCLSSIPRTLCRVAPIAMRTPDFAIIEAATNPLNNAGQEQYCSLKPQREKRK
jgi:hypothetical protein